MGFSSAGSPDPTVTGGKTQMNFGDRLLNAFGQANPIANALGGAIFGKHELGTYNPGVTVPPTAGPIPAPPINLPSVQLPDFSAMLAQTAQPKSGGGMALLKALMGAA